MTAKIITVLFLLSPPLFAQSDFDQGEKTYNQLMADEEYEEALEKINASIDDINSRKVRRKKIPSAFISFSTIEEDVDVNQLFEDRVLDNFYLEEDRELHDLHYTAGIAYREIGEYEKSISHFQDSLRYKRIEYTVDDRVFYELAQTYKKIENDTAYHNALELAFNMDPQQYEYSKELGLALYNTRQKQKSIYHLEQYLSLSDEENIDTEIYLKLAGLHIATGKYLKTQDYYQQYLEEEADDGRIQFALGYIAYSKTGNFDLALDSFDKALNNLAEDQLIQRSQCYEYSADINKKRLNYDHAVGLYQQAVEIEEAFIQKIDDKKTEIDNLQQDIDSLKRQLLKKNNYVQYNEYQFQSQELERLKREKRELDYQYEKFNSGKRRWNLAQCNEKLERYEQAIRYYEESIRANYNTNKSRERIKKIRLKIRRGY